MPDPTRSTRSARLADVERQWFVVDVADRVLGRAASQIATVLRGKHKPIFTPHVDTGDFVIVVNAGQVRLTGRKLERKLYHRHSGYMGGIRTMTAGRMLEKHPERMFERAVRGMLPKGPLGRKMITKLKVYKGAEHPHEAQQPKPLEVEA